MNLFVLPLLMGMGGSPAGGEAGGSMGFITSLLPFAAIIAIFYFLIIRPQSKKRKETEKMLSTLRKGDRVVTIGGVHGTIQSVRESTVIVKVDDNTKIEFNRSAISSVEAVAKEDKSEKIESKEDKAQEASVTSNESAENTQK
jgi:preprotein translocase subunit YajC